MAKLNNYMSDNYQNFFDNDLSTTDPDLYNSIKLELDRQQQHIELIASENIVSKAVLDAQGSIMTNKYAEGYHQKDITVDVNSLIRQKILLLKE